MQDIDILATPEPFPAEEPARRKPGRVLVLAAKLAFWMAVASAVAGQAAVVLLAANGWPLAMVEGIAFVIRAIAGWVVMTSFVAGALLSRK